MRTRLLLIVALASLWSVAAAEVANSQSSTRVQRAVGRNDTIAPSRRVRPVGQQGETARAEFSLGERINANTVSVISGTPGGTYFRMASDMAFVLDDGENLRVLPILGKGAGQNAYDIRFLKGVDLGFVRTDTLQQLRDDKRIANVERHITYVARLFNDELHVITPRDITDINQLAGKKVSFDVKGSGTDYTGRSMFKGLGLEVEAINVDQPTALDLLKRGEVSAVLSVAAKPVAVVTSFDGGGRFHLLNVPYVEALADSYLPASLTDKDYPNLVPDGVNVQTLAVGTVLGAYNWAESSDRYKRIARFIDAFFSKFDQFLVPTRHPKWREVNLGAEVPGWKRFPAAQEWLDRKREEPPTTSTTPDTFRRFLNERRPSADVDRDSLFNEFLKWRRTQE